ncbi:MAG: hypothetical protein ABSC56_04220 [Solirubrobacteraceae bacterium]|jgi:DNA-binding beta-propeller fold protein YncE
MKLRALVLATAALAVTATTASAHGRPFQPPPPPAPAPAPAPAGTVFVQTDSGAGNQVVVYDRSQTGTLTQAGAYATGGLGGQLTGSVVDHLASQDSLVYDQQAGDLLAVNAGSNTVSVFAVHGDRLFLTQVVASGGDFPASIAVRGNLVYVLNALGGGSLQGYFLAFDHLVPVPGSSRQLGLSLTATPQFTNTPGEVAFSPDGSQLLVTTKANGSAIDAFRVGPFGELSASPVVNSEPGAVPFSLTFDPQGQALVALAGTDALASFALAPTGTLTTLDTLATGATATCWIAAADGYYYLSNAGSATLSTFTASPSGQLTLVGSTPTDAGTVDATASGDGRFLYVQAGGPGIVDEFAIGSRGALQSIGSVLVPGAAGGEGIAAS